MSHARLSSCSSPCWNTWKIPTAQSAQQPLYPGNPSTGLADPVATGPKGGSIAKQVTSNTTSFSVTLEIVAKAHCLGYRIVEVPTVWRDRQHGQTNFKMGRSIVAYTPWLCLALLRGRLVRLPLSWLRRWLTA